MSNTTFLNIPIWIQRRIVGFFNSVQNVDMILDGTIQDDPTDGDGKSIGRIVAARILRERNKLPDRKFTTLEQIDNVPGVGTDTIRDFVYSLGKSADETFRNEMYASRTIYMENWALEYFRYPVETEEAFLRLEQNPAELRQFIIEKLTQLAQDKAVPVDLANAMISDLAQAYIDFYSNSTQIAGYALAVWFYDFDADNWFSWESIQKQTLRYFSYHANEEQWQMDLYLFRGFTNRGIINPGISANALPVVMNKSELTVTFWLSELYD